MNISLEAVAIFILIATVITSATSATKELLKKVPKLKNISDYALWVALMYSAILVFGLNYGILQTLGVPINSNLLHFGDLIVTTMILTQGAKAVYNLVENSSVKK